jgi:predicted transposase/invertase (TIGR01784 family)
MKTDSLFYQLFQQFPDTLFALTGQPIKLATQYRFASESVKETAFTMDGVFIPQQGNLPLYFVEAQFQKDPDLCSRMFTEIMLFLRHNTPRRDWRAVIIVPTKGKIPKIEPAYDNFASKLTIICLKDLAESENLGVELARLITANKTKAPIQARKLMQRTAQFLDDQQREALQAFIGTIMVYKFAKLTRQEIEAMLELGSFKKTRVYQETLEEGERTILVRILTRKFGALPKEMITRLNSIDSKAQLEQLADYVIDATTLEDFIQRSGI